MWKQGAVLSGAVPLSAPQARMGGRSESGHAHQRVPRYRSSCLHYAERSVGAHLNSWYEAAGWTSTLTWWQANAPQ
jgi:hypothetical protein